MKNQVIAEVTLACFTLIAVLFFIAIRAIKYPMPHNWVLRIFPGIADVGVCIWALSIASEVLPQICKAYDWEWKKTY